MEIVNASNLQIRDRFIGLLTSMIVMMLSFKLSQLINRKRDKKKLSLVIIDVSLFVSAFLC